MARKYNTSKVEIVGFRMAQNLPEDSGLAYPEIRASVSLDRHIGPKSSGQVVRKVIEQNTWGGKERVPSGKKAVVTSVSLSGERESKTVELTHRIQILNVNEKPVIRKVDRSESRRMVIAWMNADRETIRKIVQEEMGNLKAIPEAEGIRAVRKVVENRIHLAIGGRIRRSRIRELMKELGI